MTEPASVDAVSENLSSKLPTGAVLSSLRPRHFVLATLLAATGVAIGDVLLAVSRATLPVPAVARSSAMAAAVGFYGVPALLFGLLAAWIFSALQALVGPDVAGRLRAAWRDPGRDDNLAAAALSALGVLGLDAIALYGFLRGAAFEMANRRNGALSAALVAVAALPVLSLLGLPLFLWMRRLVAVLPRPRIVWTLALVALGGVLLVVAAILSVDWRIIHFGPWKALGATLVVAGLLLVALSRSGAGTARRAVLDVAVTIVLLALVVGALNHTLGHFGVEPRSRALIAEETAGAGVLLRRWQALYDRDVDGRMLPARVEPGSQ